MIFEVLKETSLITSLVLVIMLIIEYINVGSHGHLFGPLQNRRWLQYLVGTISCAIPGCVGPIMISTLFLHQMVGVGALLASLVITFGDEAFVLYASDPKSAFLLTGCLIAIGIPLGLITERFMGKNLLAPPSQKHFKVHDDEHCHNHESSGIKLFKLSEISFERALLLLGHGLILLGIFNGVFDHAHGGHVEEAKESFHLGWEQISFLVLTLFSLFIVSTVPQHFLEEHLWQHLIRKHFLRVLLWTFGALMLVEILTHGMHLEHWIEANRHYVLLLAVLIGIIPQSGPHLIFIALFMNGTIPFSILLVNSIVQEGHGALPLFAESKKNFFLLKLIKAAIAIPLGYLLLNMNL